MPDKTSESQRGISLPKGGGAIKGIGETFQPNLFTGTGNFSVPIFTSPGRNGFGAKLSLQYSTGNGNGSFGLGWQLSIPRITRKTEKGLPKYTDEDVFVMSGAEDLVLAINSPAIPAVLGYTITRYRPRTEGLFARIEKWVDDNGDVHWRATTKENITSIYGKSKSARIVDPDHMDHIYEWLLEETFDAKGNHILYEYAQEDPNLKLNAIYEQNRKYSQAYIRRILYGNTPDALDAAKKAGPERVATNHQDPRATKKRHYVFEVLFDYGDLPASPAIPYNAGNFPDKTLPAGWPLREDPFSTFRSGFEIRTLRRCTRVLMLHHFKEGELDGAPLVKSTDFTYDIHEYSRLSFLSSVTVTGYRKHPKDNTKYYSDDMPPVTFKYSEFKPQEQRYQPVTARANDYPPMSLLDQSTGVIDLFGDGLPDILQTTGTGYYYWRNLGNGMIDRRHPQHVAPAGVVLGQPNVAIGDMGGDGLADLIVTSPQMSGFYEATPDGNWKQFKKFKSMPSFDLADPNVRVTDLTGDGLSDVLMTRDHHFLWFQCLGEEGYAAPQVTERIHDLNEFPDVYFDDLASRVRLADMTGDGLNDIVLVHDGRIDYWPNLGYGRFGKRITMANTPHIGYGFDPRRLFLVDMDGTGCADLVYVDFDCVYFWFNQSGNSWSEMQTIHGTPYVSDVSAVQIADFFGTGTACLVWSYNYVEQPDGNYKVLDFCGCVKPYLLTEMSNNMGATTRAQYAPSTKFYLEDKENGQPWVTNLPFPVQVLEKTEVIDHISKTKMVTTYKHHHGYYDGREREFLGFGRVDQYDTEEFETFAGSSLHDNAEYANNKKAFHVPPVLTKTWFHSGVYFDENILAADGVFYDNKDMMDAYRKEFYKGDGDAFILNDHDVETGGIPHEAYRALRGSILRSEVYALDGSTKESHPYVVTENRYTVKQIQPKNGNANGVFLTTQRESVSYHYERNPDDPRIGHKITVVDAYGNITDTISIGYPRRVVPPELPEQGEIKILYTRSDFINKVNAPDFYFIAVPCQTRGYEVTGITWATGEPHLKKGDFLAIMDAGIAPGSFKPYEWGRPIGHVGVEKLLVEWSRSFFRKDAAADALDIDPARDPVRTLANRLPLGQIESLGLPYESYRAAFTHSNDPAIGLINGIYQQRVDAAMIKDGGYHQEDLIQNQEYWWIPSGQQAFNANKFYLVEKSRDPFGNESLIQSDIYALLGQKVIDAIGNVTQADNDYRVLQPFKIIDPNGNIAEAAFDVLGMVVGTTISGRDENNDPAGDSLVGFVPDLDQNDITLHLTNPLNNPHGILQKAATRLVYDLKRYVNFQQPNVVYTLTRETHDSDENGVPTNIQHNFVYSDGFGRQIQTKVQAEPDPAMPAQPRWVGSGSKVYNNKGKPVQQYEPFFSDTHSFGIEKHGISPTLFYDPMERVLCTIHPNHTYEKVVFDPWQQQTSDANDTVLLRPHKAPFRDDYVYGYVADFLANYQNPLDGRPFNTWYDERIPDRQNKPDPNARATPPEQKAALKTEAHANTPTTAHLDTFGRSFLTVANNGKDNAGADIPFKTHVELDIEGNDVKITDPRQYELNNARAANAQIHNFIHFFDIAGRKLRIDSVDAGLKLSFLDVTNKPFYVWDANGNTFFTKYDSLRRPAEVWVKKSGEAQYFLAQKTIYGEDKANPEQTHHRQQIWKVYDGAGLLENEFYDFKGNISRTKRTILKNGQVQVEWARIADPTSYVFDPAAAAAMLDTSLQGIFTTKSDFDAINRMTTTVAPDSTVQEFLYNEANLLASIKVIRPGGVSIYIKDIDYNEKGQRTKIEYGNGVTTEYSYEPETFRLIAINTIRNGAQLPKELQELKYTYDPVGNITQIQDDAHPRIYNNNNIIDPVCSYTYDPIYRLIEATGREHEAMTACHYREAAKKHTESIQLTNQPMANGHALCNYTETYEYDPSGNIKRISHHNRTRNIRWNRLQTFDAESNRLKTSNAGCPDENAFDFLANHDANGNILKMPHLPQMKWNHQNQLIEVQLKGGENPNKAYYQYDASGQRVRKVVVKNGKTEERIYIGGYEIYTERNGANVTLRRDTVHIMDDKNRIALIEDEKNLIDGSIINSRVRCQLSNHLGSSHLEVDDSPDAKIISYEEYYPYGETAYMAGYSLIEVSQKRYRYSGKERDDETGLYYYGARYYASWLGRWVSTDPNLTSLDMNLFAFSGNNPITRIDTIGLSDEQVNNVDYEITTDPNEAEQIMIPVTEETRKIIDNLDRQGIMTGYGRTPEGVEFYTIPSDVGRILESTPPSEEVVEKQEVPKPMNPPEGIIYKDQSCYPDVRYILDPITGLPLLLPSYMESEEPKISVDDRRGVPVRILTEKELIRAQEQARFEQREEFEMAREPLTVLMFITGDPRAMTREEFRRRLEAGSMISGWLNWGVPARTGKQSNIRGPGGFKEVADRQTASQEAISQLKKSAETELGEAEVNIRRMEWMELKEYENMKKNR